MGCNCGNNAATYVQNATGARPSGPNITQQSQAGRSAAGGATNITGAGAKTGRQAIATNRAAGSGGGFRVPGFSASTRATVHHSR